MTELIAALTRLANALANHLDCRDAEIKALTARLHKSTSALAKAIAQNQPIVPKTETNQK